MRLNRANFMTISLLVELTASVVISEPVSMYVRLEPTSQNARYLNFYNDTFKRLYDCMTNTANGQCNVQTVHEGSGHPLPGENYKATNVMALQSARLDRSYFTCLYSQSANVLNCTRYNTGQNSTCQCGIDKCVCFSFQASSICDNQCAHFMWTYPDEELILSPTDRFESCDPVCTTTTEYIPTVHSVEPSSHPSVTSRLPSDHTPDATTNSSSAAGIANTSSRKRSPSKQIPIIIGVVCSLLVIIIVVVVVGIMYRRRKLIKGQAGNNGISSPHADASYNGSHGQRSLSSNVSNTPDVLTSLPHSGRGGERNESEDGYYTIDKDLEINRYENRLNTVSSGNSRVTGEYALGSRELNRYENALGVTSSTFRIQEQDDNPQIPHTHEGDYFVISENDNDKDGGSVNEERNADGEYSLAKNVSTVDVIDVSSQPKNVYSRFGDDTTVRNNPYHMLQPHEILDPRKTSTGVTPIKGTVDDDALVDNTTIELAETDSRSQAAKTVPNMTRDTSIVFPEYSTVNKTKT